MSDAVHHHHQNTHDRYEGSLYIGPGRHPELVVHLPFVPTHFTSSIEANAGWHCGGPDLDHVTVALDGDTIYVEAVVEGPVVVVRYSAEP